MSRRSSKVKGSPFKKPSSSRKQTASRSAAATPSIDPPRMTLFDVPDDEEDEELKAMKEVNDRAALVLQHGWKKRPRWSQIFATQKIVEYVNSRPKSAHQISKEERKRLENMGFTVPASLAYGETPVLEFLELLKHVATMREEAFGGVKEGDIKGKLSGVFYDIGCGVGTLCLSAVIHHNFSHVVGFEILQGLFDESLDLERHYNMDVKPRLIRRPDKDPPKLRFIVGDACSVKWGPLSPTIVYCHCSVWDERLMLKLAGKLCAVPSDTIIITVTNPLPNYTTPSGRETIHFKMINRIPMKMPWGVATAFLQQRKLTEREEYEIAKAKDERAMSR